MCEPGRLRPHTDFSSNAVNPAGPSRYWRRGWDELGPSWPSPFGRCGFASACIFARAKMCEPRRLRPHTDYASIVVNPSGPPRYWRRGWDELGPSWPSPFGRCGFASACIFARAKMCEPGRLRPHTDFSSNAMNPAGPSRYWGGEGGIRTHGGLAPSLDFESSPFGQLRHLSVR